MTDYLEEAMKEADETLSKSDLLIRVKETLKALRALDYEKKDLEQRLDEVKRQIRELSDETLVKLFMEAQLTSLSIEAEGNYPAVTAKRLPYYNAGIPEDKQTEAFTWLTDNGHADIIKTTITVALGMKERPLAQNVEKFLDQAGIPFNSKLAVHPSTLKAFVKSEVEAGHDIPRDALGVFVGETIRVTPDKK